MKKSKELRLRHNIGQAVGIFGIFAFASAALFGQAPKPDPDVLELSDGERLIGHFVSAAGGSLVFHSDAAGDVTIGWDKVKTLKSSGKFAVVEKGSVLGRHTDVSKVPQGTVTATDKQITVDAGNGSAPAAIAIADATNVVPQASFLNAFKTPSIGADWHGSAGFGLDLVSATQKSRNITAGVSLARTVSSESWINPRYRTLVDFNVADSKLSQSGQKDITTDLIHGALEHDMYLSSRLFAFGSADFLHSSSQGMKLQQTYGGGLGVVVLKDAHQELDAKAAIDYVRQTFEPTPPPVCVVTATNNCTKPTKSLVGASLGETYTRSFKGGVAFHEGLTFIPAFNDTSAWTMSSFANFSIPVHKRLLITIGGLDSYVNEPPPSFKKNSFEFVTQVAYKIN